MFFSHVSDVIMFWQILLPILRDKRSLPFHLNSVTKHFLYYKYHCIQYRCVCVRVAYMSLARTSIWHHYSLQHDGCHDFASCRRGISSNDEASVELGCVFCFLCV